MLFKVETLKIKSRRKVLGIAFNTIISHTFSCLCCRYINGQLGCIQNWKTVSNTQFEIIRTNILPSNESCCYQNENMAELNFFIKNNCG